MYGVEIIAHTHACTLIRDGEWGDKEERKEEEEKNKENESITQHVNINEWLVNIVISQKPNQILP